jgi:hypothetical protein
MSDRKHAFSGIIDALKAHNEQQIAKDNGDKVECVSCGEIHEAIPRNYVGRRGYACSDDCWDEWVNFGRWERPE